MITGAEAWVILDPQAGLVKDIKAAIDRPLSI
jgi:hypothetical protein